MSSRKVITFDRKEMFPFTEDAAQHELCSCNSKHETLSPKSSLSLKETLMNFEISLLKEMIAECNGSLSKTAQELKIPQQTLQNKLDKFHLRDYVKELQKH